MNARHECPHCGGVFFTLGAALQETLDAVRSVAGARAEYTTGGLRRSAYRYSRLPTSVHVADRLGISVQAANNRLRSLERLGLIERARANVSGGHDATPWLPVREEQAKLV